MNCRLFNEIVVDLVRGEVTDREALEHASGCPECGEVLRCQRELSGWLREIRTEQSALQASSAVEMAVLRGFRNRHRETSRWIWRAAAVFLLALAAGVLYQIYRTPVPEQAFTAATPSATETREYEVTSEFISLYDNPALVPSRMVRVRMSPDALLQLGLAVENTGTNEPVLADIVLSEEGTPQAIRFVRKTSF